MLMCSGRGVDMKMTLRLCMVTLRPLVWWCSEMRVWLLLLSCSHSVIAAAGAAAASLLLFSHLPHTGITYSDDKLLQTRIFSYADTQRHRYAIVNHRQSFRGWVVCIKGGSGAAAVGPGGAELWHANGSQQCRAGRPMLRQSLVVSVA